jgi:hypothetical protein
MARVALRISSLRTPGLTRQPKGVILFGLPEMSETKFWKPYGLTRLPSCQHSGLPNRCTRTMSALFASRAEPKLSPIRVR